MSAFVCIATLLNSKTPRDQIISFLNTIQSNSLKQYLLYANIYSGVGPKTKNQLIEMIIYGCMCNKIKDIQSIESIDRNIADKILKKQ